MLNNDIDCGYLMAVRLIYWFIRKVYRRKARKDFMAFPIGTGCPPDSYRDIRLQALHSGRYPFPSLTRISDKSRLRILNLIYHY